MAVMGLTGLFALALPIGLLFKFDLAHINALWTVYVLYVLVMNAAVVRRYRQGRWRTSQVIEKS
jgi:Na+-driven multidrug efflux pump